MLKLWIDDDARRPDMLPFRYPPDDTWTIATSSAEAIEIMQREGFPAEMGLDHDLGGHDTVIRFLRWLIAEHGENNPPPPCEIHTQNPVGAENIRALLKAWENFVFASRSVTCGRLC